MSNNPLLSTYRTGENRVTASMMAVFERLDLDLVRDILAAACGAGDELRAVTFENQIVETATVPDARISGRFTWWFETKTTRGAYGSEGHGRRQLRAHAEMLSADPDALLFVLTPDPVRPEWFDGIPAEVDEFVASRITWVSFRQLADAIAGITADVTRLLGEQTRFLLAELIALFESDGLLTNDDTVIVAARRAWPEYHRLSAYICQPGRTFRMGITHLGFYADGAIQPVIARIEHQQSSVPFTREEAAERRQIGEVRLAEFIERCIDGTVRPPGEQYGVLLLSSPDDDQTAHLFQPIVNDTVSATGRPWAWVLGQRYTSLAKLRSGAQLTSQL